MKHLAACLVALTACTSQSGTPHDSTSGAPRHIPREVDQHIDDTERFIFFSVLEGLYADGLHDDEVDMLLRQTSDGAHVHFIYGCPICMWTIRALESYRQRPGKFYGSKSRASSFGPGLEPELRSTLLGDDLRSRLEVLNTLMNRWLDRRIESQHLPLQERESLRRELEKKRQEGQKTLQAFRKEGALSYYAPAYAELEECAACNGVLGKKLPACK